MIAAEVKYKKTGIDYIPEIPENWKIVRLKNLADVFGRIGFRGYTVADIVDKGQGAISLSPSNIEDQSIVYNNSTYISLEKYYESPEIVVEEGDTILVKTASVGKVALVRNLDDKATINPQLVVFKNYKTDRTYFYYLLTSHLIQKQIERDTSGGVVGTITQQKIKNYWGTLPPLEEQKVIANYLDSQSVQITSFIQTKQRFIELLKEQRQSIITNAVTKGIDEKAKMKEMGVDWIPQIPFHWEIRRLKYLVELYKHNKSGTYSTNLDYKIALENIDNWTGKYVESVSPDFEGEGRYFKQGDVLFGKLRPYLAKAFLPDKDGICVSEILVFTPNSDLITNEFLFQRILTKGFIDIVDGSTYGAKMPRAGWDFIGNMRIAYPPTIEEQIQIVEYIKSETKTLDIAISKAEREIELIKEYREAMIAEAVTGKMKL